MEEGMGRKQLPLRQQADKPMLRYSSPGMPVQLFNPSQVASYRGSFTGDKGHNPLSLFLQRSEPQITQHSVHKTNPYARPASAQDVEAHMGANGAVHGLVLRSNLSSNSNSSLASSVSNSSLSSTTSPPNGYTTNNAPLQTNTFLRPRSGLNKQNSSDSLTSGESASGYAEKQSTGVSRAHQKISQFSSNPQKDSYQDSVNTHIENEACQRNDTYGSNADLFSQKEIENGLRDSHTRHAASLRDVNVSDSVTRQSLNAQKAEGKEMKRVISEQNNRSILYTSFTRPAVSMTHNSKDSSEYVLEPGGGRAAPPAHSKPPLPVRRPPANYMEAINRIEPRPPSNSRPSSTSSSSSSRAASVAAETAAKVRNLNYTPNKPYHEVSSSHTQAQAATPAGDQVSQYKLKTGPAKAQHTVTQGTTPSATPVSHQFTSSYKNATQYYHKMSRTEGKMPYEPRPVTEGAAKKNLVTKDEDKEMKPPVNDADEWEDMDTQTDGDDDDEEDDGDDEDLGPDKERMPGDGEDQKLDDDEDDDGMDGLDDDDYDTDDESDCYSIKTSVSSRASSVRTLSATRRLSSLSISGKSSVQSRPQSAAVTDDREPEPALSPSLFSDVPPTINFVTDGFKVEQLPWDIRKLLKWKMSPITPNIVKATIARSFFRASKKNHDWLGYWGKHMKAPGFKAIREYQKINHFPGSFQIGRKDRLWRNLYRMQVQFGKKEFSFFPQTFCLPFDLKVLKRVWEEGGSKQKWIIKPPASARGIGIKVIHKWNQIPKRRPVIVQKYLAHPYLINGSKFDLRIYVYVTSFEPLRLYIYDDGLVRFASAKYSSSLKHLNNRYMHLTNYSINKKNNEYKSNADESVCQGHKWGLKALWGFLKQKGVNTQQIWENIKDLVAKTVISAETYVSSNVKANCRSRYVCHELFGFDIMLDEHLKPWIIEVNISPSLHSNSKLDINIKGGMIKDLLNMCSFQLPNRKDLTSSSTESVRHSVPADLCMDKRLHQQQFSPDERAKHVYFTQRHTDQFVQSSIMDILTPADVRMLIETIDEDSRRGNFQRVIPSSTSHKYLRFFEYPRYFNLLLDQWCMKYHRMETRGIAMLEAVCQKGIQLDNPTEDPHHQWSPPSSTFHNSPSYNMQNKDSLRSSSVLPRVKKRRPGHKPSDSFSSAAPTPRPNTGVRSPPPSPS